MTRPKVASFLNGSLLLYYPDAPLSRFVNHFWFAKGCDARGKPIERFLPNASMDLMINLGDDPETVLGPKETTLRHCWVAGLQPKYIRIKTSTHLNMMGVEFKAGGAYPFFEFPMSELRESFVDLDLIWGRVAGETRDSILESKSDEEKFRRLETLLLRQLKVCNEDQLPIEHAIRAIAHSSPAPRIRCLAEILGMNHKRLIQQFKAMVGAAPKTFSRICRFQRALRAICEGNGRLDLTSVAVDCEYFDQSHFIKEFESFSGMTPGEYSRVKGLFPGWIPEREDSAC